MLRAWTPFRDDYPQERRGLSFCPRAAASVENDRYLLAEEAAVAGLGPKGTEVLSGKFRGCTGLLLHGVSRKMAWKPATLATSLCSVG